MNGHGCKASFSATHSKLFRARFAVVDARFQFVAEGR
jgi:hypothetical protein